MSSRKRWSQVYSGANPFGLPQTIMKGIKTHAEERQEIDDQQLKYLWVYVSEDGSGQGRGPTENLDVDGWLSVIDESASLGVENVVISLGCPLSDHPEVFHMADWAGSTHNMLVGIHIYRTALTREEARRLAKLDTKWTCLFVDNDCMDSVEFLNETGLRVFPADGQHQHVVSPECRLPEQMTCVDARGTMYTCGLVLGHDAYRLGNFFERKLETVMTDDSLPHVIPEGVSKAHHQCNGCPPLMVRRMQQERR